MDSSSLINMGRRYAPMDSAPFRGLWDQVNELVAGGRLIAPDEVYKEVEIGADEIAGWAAHRKEMFVATDDALFRKTLSLIQRHSKLADLGKTRYHADPWVVALAMQHSETLLSRGVVVSDERQASAGSIPSVCTVEGIECLSHIEWFERMGWGFT